MKIALAQIKVLPGLPEENLKTILCFTDQAREQEVDLVVFPEMCVGGYLVGDKWLEDHFCRDLMEYNEDIRAASQGIAIAFGNIFLDDHINERTGDTAPHPNRDGRHRKYNAVYVVQNGEYVCSKSPTRILPDGVAIKTIMPCYREFDDPRYFFSARDQADDFGIPLEDLLHPLIITERDGKKTAVGFELCEDLWCHDYRCNKQVLNPTKILIKNNAEYIVNLSASPWTFGKNNARDRRVRFLQQECGDGFVPFLYVNCVGAQNNGKNIITFDGGSTVYNANGEIIDLVEQPYSQQLLIADDVAAPSRERVKDSKIAQKYQALLEGIRSYPSTWLIGLSGGIDSSVVAALLAAACGPENITGINMPYIYNSQQTRQAAAQVAENLGIRFLSVPIGDIVESVNQTLNREVLEKAGADLQSLTRENIQAKIRGTDILSNLSGNLGTLFTNNGNKLEIALGYATLYGDVDGALAVLGDLTKVEVFDMARYLNREIYRKEVIPQALIPDELFRFDENGIPPTAELKEEQIDPMKFGYHDALLDAVTNFQKKSMEDIARWYLDGTLEANLDISTELIQRWGIDSPQTFVKDLEWFFDCIQKNVFKRIQSPPIILTSKSAFGFDIRESILPCSRTCEFKRLREIILKMERYNPASDNKNG